MHRAYAGHRTSVAASFRAGWLVLWHRPAIRAVGVLCALWVAILGYALLYVALLALRGSAEATDVAALRESLLPANLVGQVLPFLNGVGGALAITPGALSVGSDYGWGTMGLILTQRPSRLDIFVGRLLALWLLLLLLVVAVFTVAFAASAAIAVAERGSPTPPAAPTVLRGLAAGWLILAAWSAPAVLLAVLLRGAAAAIGIGLLYALVAENALAVAALLAPALRPFTDLLLGANSGALARTFRAGSTDTALLPPPDAGHNLAILAIYLVACNALTAYLLRRQEIT